MNSFNIMDDTINNNNSNNNMQKTNIINDFKIDDNEFYRACFNGDFENALNILKLGINLNKRFESGRTLLHIACIKNFYGLVKLLVKYGCNEYLKDSFSRTALHYAAMKGGTAIVRYLVERNTFIDYNTEESTKLTKDFLDAKDVHGKTAIHYACQQNQINSVLPLVKNRLANVNVADVNGETPIQIAYDNKNYELFELLVKYDAFVNSSILREICSQGNLKLAEMLVDANKHRKEKINWNIVDENDNSTIYFAIKYSFNVELVKLLLENGARSNTKDIQDIITDIKSLKIPTSTTSPPTSPPPSSKKKHTSTSTTSSPTTSRPASPSQKDLRDQFTNYLEYVILLLKYGCFKSTTTTTTTTTTSTTNENLNNSHLLMELLDSIYSLYLRSDTQTQLKYNYRIVYMFALAIYSAQLNIKTNTNIRKWIDKLTKTNRHLRELYVDSTTNAWSLQMLARVVIQNNYNLNNPQIDDFTTTNKRLLVNNSICLPNICVKYLQYEFI